MLISGSLILIILLAIRRESFLKFNSFFVVSLLYLVSFGVFPIFFEIIDIPVSYNKGWLRYITRNTFRESLQDGLKLYSLIGYILFLIGYKISKFSKKELIQAYYQKSTVLKKIGLLLFIIGISSFIIYLSSLGSITNAFLMNNRMLFEDDKVDVSSSVSFLKGFSRIILASTYVLWANMKINNNIRNKFWFWLSFIFSVIYLFYGSGRLSLIQFLGTFIIAQAIMVNRFPKVRLVVFTLIALFITLFGKSLFRIFLYNDLLDNSLMRIKDDLLIAVLDFMGEFSFPYLSFINNLGTSSKWLYFQDLIFSFTYAFPAFLFPDIPNTSIQNTINLFGYEISAGGIPSDILSYGFLNLGIIGFSLILFLFGTFCKWIDSFVKSPNNPLSTIFTVVLVLIIGFRVLYFDPKHLIKGSFYFYFSLILIFLMLKFHFKYRLK